MNVAYNRDCMDVMREYPDGYFDLAVVDPPYGINITGRSKSVHVERERERERGSAGQSHSEITRIGGVQLSRPKFTTRSTTKRHQMRNIFPNSNE